ncbi:YugN-like family protein [Paenibacillus sp. 32O-W]|uniref:YugN family protein n=1 Tax=Paenibacillus sp. 32O-W TaxID=1695218 RepID=UPI0007226111|nr:YugN family protein [Paenibacillus sp. 32O-W]ALS26814.1 YugN-like family protein [Paenibacillus sp. 32O-W]
MIPIDSRLVSREQEFVPMRNMLEQHRFTVGGNWDYDHGSFDCNLDGDNKVWLRLPFTVTNGNLDADTEDNDAKIRLGQPYVLKHLYNEGLDTEAQPRVMGSVIDQFQDPVDPDAQVERQWVEKAGEVLRQVEAHFPA